MPAPRSTGDRIGRSAVQQDRSPRIESGVGEAQSEVLRAGERPRRRGEPRAGQDRAQPVDASLWQAETLERLDRLEVGVIEGRESDHEPHAADRQNPHFLRKPQSAQRPPELRLGGQVHAVGRGVEDRRHLVAMAGRESIGEPVEAVSPGELVRRRPDAQLFRPRLVVQARRARSVADDRCEWRGCLDPAGSGRGEGGSVGGQHRQPGHRHDHPAGGVLERGR